MDNIRILRVIACLGVFWVHISGHMALTEGMKRLSGLGAMGVYVFFVISGYLACQTEEGNGKLTAGGCLRYYIRRACRILPLYYAVIFYNVLLHELLLQDVPPDPDGLFWLRYLFLTNAVIPAHHNFWSNLSSTWTISIFLFFYLLAPFLGKAGKTAGRMLLLWAASAAAMLLWQKAGLSAYLMPLHYLHYFLLGMTACRFVQQGEKQAKAAAAVCLLAAAAFLVAGGYDSFPAWSFLSAGLIVAGRKYRMREGSLFQKAIRVLDRYSFTIYLVHSVVAEGIELLHYHVPLSNAGVLAIALAGTAAGSLAAFWLVEKPGNNLGRYLAGRVKI